MRSRRSALAAALWCQPAAPATTAAQPPVPAPAPAARDTARDAAPAPAAGDTARDTATNREVRPAAPGPRPAAPRARRVVGRVLGIALRAAVVYAALILVLGVGIAVEDSRSR